MRGLRQWLCLVALLALAAPAAAVPADPRRAVAVAQPDGSSFVARRIGDERGIRVETPAGLPVVKDPASGWWYYATADGSGALTATRARAGIDDPDATVRPVRGAPVRATAATVGPRRAALAPRPAMAPPGASGRLLVICVEWADSYPPNTFPLATIGNLCNQPNYNATGSVADYYAEVSYGKFALTVDVVGQNGAGDWLDLADVDSGGSYDYYCNNAQGTGNYPQNSQGLVEAVVRAVDGWVNFADYDLDGDGFVDAVGVIVAGTADGSNSQFWPHAWSLGDHAVTVDGVTVDSYFISNELNDDSTVATIGAICHEYGHVLGLPDLYDYTFASYGVGNYCLMGYGCDAGAPATGSRPTHLCAWSKYQLGWITPTAVTFGEHTINAVEASDEAYLVPATLNNRVEYFLVENRRPTGFDGTLPGDGLLIYHVNEAKLEVTNNDERAHKLVDVECADGQDADGWDDLDKLVNFGDAADYWYRNQKDKFGVSTNPSTRVDDGSASSIEIYAISDAGAAMSFKVSTPYNSQIEHRDAISYPNPFNLSLVGTARIRTEPPTEISRIRIYTLRGELVREFNLDEIGSDGMVDWDGTNDRGQLVASGVYLLVLTDRGGDSCIGHLTLIK